ncbi:MAG: response regulator [Gemmatimonadetes bacterium]|nr:response regulator [Gemmatimonadota bacterium]
MRELVRVALTRAGFRILVAREGSEALMVSASEAGRIELMLTDVVMPGLNGRELARRFRATRPDARVLFMSGYAADVIAAEGELLGDADLLVKPFSPDELVERVRTALHG